MAEKDFKRNGKSSKQVSFLRFLKKISVEDIFKWIRKAHLEISQNSELIKKAFLSSGFIMRNLAQPQRQSNEMEIEMNGVSNNNQEMEIEVEENDGIPCDVPESILLSTEEFQEVLSEFENLNLTNENIEEDGDNSNIMEIECLRKGSCYQSELYYNPQN